MHILKWKCFKCGWHFHWSVFLLFLMNPIDNKYHWFRRWLGTDQADCLVTEQCSHALPPKKKKKKKKKKNHTVCGLVKDIKDRAHLSTFKIFIFEKFSCFIVLVVFLVIVQSSELVSVWFCEQMTFFPNFLITTSLRYMWAGLPWGCRPLAG